MTKEVKKEEKIEPIRPVDFGIMQHKFNSFDAVVPEKYKDKLEDPAVWTHVASKIRAGDEIRAVAHDFSFVAYLFVTFRQGTDVRAKLLNIHELDVVEATQPQGKYEVKLCGRLKWCVINRENGEHVKENIATQSEAFREMEEYQRALAA